MVDTDVRAELLKRLKDYYTKVQLPKLRDDTKLTKLEFNVDAVQFKFLSIDYENLDTVQTTPSELRKHRIDNPTNAEITSKFTESVESRDEFTWSIKEGLKLGGEVTFKVSAPLIGEGGVKASAELSLESTQEKKVSLTQSWTQEVEVKVPAKTSIEATTLLELASLNTPFTITLLATGNVKVDIVTTTTRGGNTTSYEINGWFPLERGWGSIGPPPVPFLPDVSSRQFKAKGNFKGVNGLYISVTTKPLGTL